MMEGNEYDPHSNRKEPEENLLSDALSMANLVKSAVGTGSFAMANAFACVGIVLGFVGTLFVGILINISLQLLVRTHYAMCVYSQKPKLEYDEVLFTALTSGSFKDKISRTAAMTFVNVLLIICQVGVGAVYCVFIAGIVQEFLDPTKSISQILLVLTLFPFLLMMNLLKNLHSIALVSVIGNIFIFTALTIGMVYALKDGIGDDWVLFAQDVSLYPKFLGTVFFSLCSPVLILEIEHNMKKPQNFVKPFGVLNLGMFLINILHALVGGVAYMKYGSKVGGNFIRDHEQNDAATSTALILQGLTIYFTYGLHCYMPIMILNKEYVKPHVDETSTKILFIWDLIIRLVITLITCILAALIPQLDLLMGLVGAVCLSILGILLPVVMYLIVSQGNFGICKWKLQFGLLLFIVGFAAIACATYANVKVLIQQ